MGFEANTAPFTVHRLKLCHQSQMVRTNLQLDLFFVVGVTTHGVVLSVLFSAVQFPVQDWLFLCSCAVTLPGLAGFCYL